MSVSADFLGIYYSGASSHEQNQDNPSLSLGGFRSGVMVSNAMLNNIFDELGIYELNTGQSVYRCIFIKNNHTTDVITNLSLYISGKKDFETIKFGVSSPANNVSAVQFLNSQESSPYNISFNQAYVVGDKITLISSLPAQGVIALWLNREINSGATLRNADAVLNFNFAWE